MTPAGVGRQFQRQKSVTTLLQAGLRQQLQERVLHQAKRTPRTNVNANQCDEIDTVICSRSSQDRRSRKASTVKDPILQNVKHQKSQAV
ncbi:HORMA domain-containing protein 1 [Quillaja saponaria]|uniref:HORMA domain-containing protein 1 n=1 Tax=Quillaja saponaria TaxID=32244 RepID=A0AAD7LGI9_QUISA|nr:HORMA domain-containing protein 1 [Quillaja saponaria]